MDIPLITIKIDEIKDIAATLNGVSIPDPRPRSPIPCMGLSIYEEPDLFGFKIKNSWECGRPRLVGFGKLWGT